ncbi:MAG TPA: hypothetical protein VF110_05980, partial [Burkholderiales bacterium]
GPRAQIDGGRDAAGLRGDDGSKQLALAIGVDGANQQVLAVDRAAGLAGVVALRRLSEVTRGCLSEVTQRGEGYGVAA